MIEIRGVTARRGEREVLREVDLVLRERRIGVIGANGGGKSTFLRLLNGLQMPARGDVLVDGVSTRDGKAVRRKVGFVFQNPDLQIVMPTVAEDLAFGLKNLGLSKGEATATARRTLEEFGLAHVSERLVHQLSEGEKQLVAIAGVLAMQPDYLALDEPTTLLDIRNKKRVMATVDRLPQVVILVSHDLDLLASFDRVLCIMDGRIVADGTPSETISAYLELCR